MSTTVSPDLRILSALLSPAKNNHDTLLVSHPVYGRCFAAPYVTHCDPDADYNDTLNFNLIPVSAVKTYSKTVIQESVIEGVYYSIFEPDPIPFESPQNAEGITPLDLLVAKLLGGNCSLDTCFDLPRLSSELPEALAEVHHAFGPDALTALPKTAVKPPNLFVGI